MRGPSIWPSGLLLSLLLFLITHTAAGPGQVHPPLCPYGSELAGRGRVFLRCWYDYQDIKKYSGSYRAFTKGQMWDNLTVTDITPNYPAPEGHGKFLSPFGEYAENRFQFSDLHEKYIPKFDKTFDFTHDVNAPSYGYRDENDCLTYHWESHYLATLLKPYGYVIFNVQRSRPPSLPKGTISVHPLQSSSLHSSFPSQVPRTLTKPPILKTST